MSAKKATKTARQEIVDHFSAELDHNQRWVLIHTQEGEHGAAQRRRDHCEKLLRFLEWLHLLDEPDKACTGDMVMECKAAVISSVFGIQALGERELLDRLESLYLAGVKAGYEAKG